MEWAVGIPLALLLLACPLMMIAMIVGGWLFARRSGGGHAAHGMMMCMGHGGRDNGHTETADLVDELKAERARIDGLIVRATGERKG